MKAETGNKDAYIAYAYVPMTTNEYTFIPVGAPIYVNLLSMLAVICSSIGIQLLIARMQTEKVGKVRDFMRMMGMQDTAYYVSYFVFYSMSAVVLSTMITVILLIMAFPNVNALIIWITNYLILLMVFPFALIIK